MKQNFPRWAYDDKGIIASKDANKLLFSLCWFSAARKYSQGRERRWLLFAGRLCFLHSDTSRLNVHGYQSLRGIFNREGKGVYMPRRSAVSNGGGDTIMADEAEELLTVREVARRLRVDDTTVRRWIKSGALEAITLPHRGKRQAYRVKKSTLDALLRSPHLPG
jgi:excisionase family DNA binding protein